MAYGARTRSRPLGSATPRARRVHKHPLGYARSVLSRPPLDPPLRTPFLWNRPWQSASHRGRARIFLLEVCAVVSQGQHRPRRVSRTYRRTLKKGVCACGGPAHTVTVPSITYRGPADARARDGVRVEQSAEPQWPAPQNASASRAPSPRLVLGYGPWPVGLAWRGRFLWLFSYVGFDIFLCRIYTFRAAEARGCRDRERRKVTGASRCRVCACLACR